MAPSKSLPKQSNTLTNYFLSKSTSSQNAKPSQPLSSPASFKPSPQAKSKLTSADPKKRASGVTKPLAPIAQTSMDVDVISISSDSSSGRVENAIVISGSSGSSSPLLSAQSRPTPTRPFTKSSTPMSDLFSNHSRGSPTKSPEAVNLRKRSLSSAVSAATTPLESRASKSPKVDIATSSSSRNISASSPSKASGPHSSQSAQDRMGVYVSRPTNSPRKASPLIQAIESASSVNPASNAVVPEHLTAPAQTSGPPSVGVVSRASSAKRSAPDPPTLSASSKRRKTSSTPSKTKPIPMDDDEIIPSSEGEEDEMPTREFSSIPVDVSFNNVATSSPKKRLTANTSESLIAPGPFVTDSQSHRISMESQNSEGMVEMALGLASSDSMDLDNGPSQSHLAAAPGDDSDEESEKVMRRALTSKLNTVDDDDDLFDDSFLAGPSKTTRKPSVHFSSAENATSRVDVKGKGKAIEPITPKKPISSRVATPALEKAKQSLVTSSPLTPGTSPSKARHGSTWVPGERKFPKVYVEIPDRRSASVFSRATAPLSPTNAKSPAKASEATDLSSKTKAMPSRPPPVFASVEAVRKKVKMPKSAGISDLDRLLKNNKEREKKYGDIMDANGNISVNPDPMAVDPDNTSPMAASSAFSRGTTAAEMTPATQFDGLITGRLQSLLAASEDEERNKRWDEREAAMTLRRLFWKPDAEETEYKKLYFPTIDCSTGGLRSLRTAMENGDHGRILALLRHQVLSLEDIIPGELFDWLLDLAVLHPSSDLGDTAVRCLQTLLSSNNESVKEVELDFDTVQRLLKDIGARDDRLILAAGGRDETAPMGTEGVSRFPAKDRIDRANRLAVVVTLFARSKQVVQSDVCKILLALVLLAQDPTVTPEAYRNVSDAVHDLMANLDHASRKKQFKLELDLCRALMSATETRYTVEAIQVLRVIPRSSQCASRIIRWTVIGLIGGISVLRRLNEESWFLPPPLQLYGAILDGVALPLCGLEVSTKFKVKKNMYFDELADSANLFGLAVTDLHMYGRTSKTLDLFEEFEQKIGRITSEILETKADLDETRAKDELYRLRIRINYQIGQGQRTVRGIYAERGTGRGKEQTNINTFFSNAAPSA